MPARWTSQEEKEKRKELEHLYIEKKKTIFEIAEVLGMSWQGVYCRIQRLGIKVDPTRKITHRYKRRITLPKPSPELAEFVGIMLGDGHIDPTNSQVRITINTITDKNYIQYVSNLIEDLFCTYISYTWRKSTVTVFITSVDLVKQLRKIGLRESNKVKAQVKVPSWILKKKKYKKQFIRGFFDTDGSIYKLRFGTQMAWTNRSLPLLQSTKTILEELAFHPSKISSFKVYLTRQKDLKRYTKRIGFGNSKHQKRAKKFGII